MMAWIATWVRMDYSFDDAGCTTTSIMPAQGRNRLPILAVFGG
jgi:hypothetical protein